jgi:hypothetical protein
MAGREEDNAVALVRVYCGVATAEIAPWLTVAVVDDAGRLLDMRHISDDPAGYAYLVALLAERSGGSCSVAMDRHDHLVAQLLAATNRPLAISDEMSLHDFADRFADDTSYDERQAPQSQRRAVGLARALQAGALYASAQSPSWDLDQVKPVLSAHAALVAGRQASAVALREVLRELYPAALRAYLDPAEFIPLKILEAFPEPGLVTSAPSTRSRESAVVAELTAGGVTDATTAVNAISALRVAVEESRGWNGNRLLAPAVAETVRQAVAAVRACDAATAALVGSLVERLNELAAGMPARTAHPTAAPVSPAVPRRPAAGPAAEVPHSRIAPRVSAASAAAAGIGAGAGYGSGAGAFGAPMTYPDTGFASPDQPDWPRSDDLAGGYPAAGGYSSSDYSAYSHGQSNGASPYSNGSGASSYGNGSSYGGSTNGGSTSTHGSDWERQYGAAPSYGPDTLSFSMDPLTAPLDPHQRPPERPSHSRAAPVQETDRPDDDLLIFSQASSVWFTNADDDTMANWVGLSSDDGWRAAEQLTHPSIGPETTAGLPRRVPQANLVPGSATSPVRQLRIVRDPKSIAAHTEGYFRGWRRGQEIGGFAVGQRDRAAWEFNREQRAKQGAARLS